MKVFHVVNWYPTSHEPNAALWIKRHIQSLDQYVDKQYVLHLEVASGNTFERRVEKVENGESRVWILPTKHWFIIEILITLRLLAHLLRLKANQYDIINFHIAYPLLTYWHFIKKIFKKPVIITEHWSAYHYNFGVQGKLPRIQKIFRQNIPVIAVSHSLIRDIMSFSKANFPYFVLPNVVDQKVFFPSEAVTREHFFFMVSKWSRPKDPFVILEAFKNFSNFNPHFNLVIAGYGQDYEKMNKWAVENSLTEKITFPGKIGPELISDYMRKCKAFLHCSEYETFSVVCAEALSCHTPVIASSVGGIKEIITNDNGILMDSKNPEDWAWAFKMALERDFHFDNNDFFSNESVGKKYKLILEKLI